MHDRFTEPLSPKKVRVVVREIKRQGDKVIGCRMLVEGEPCDGVVLVPYAKISVGDAFLCVQGTRGALTHWQRE